MEETVKLKRIMTSGTEEGAGASFLKEEKSNKLYVVVMRRYYENTGLEGSSYVQAVFSSKENAERESKRAEQARGGKVKGFVEEYDLNPEFGNYGCQNWGKLYG